MLGHRFQTQQGAFAPGGQGKEDTEDPAIQETGRRGPESL